MPYVTTSRKAGPVTRRLARSLSSIFPGCTYENRGKRNMDSVISRALYLGYPRIILVYESHGNPSEIRVVDVRGKDEWDIVSHVKFNVVKVEKVKKGDFAVEEDEVLSPLFRDYDEEKDESGKKRVHIKMNKNYLTVSLEGRDVIVLKILPQ